MPHIAWWSLVIALLALPLFLAKPVPYKRNLWFRVNHLAGRDVLFTAALAFMAAVQMSILWNLRVGQFAGTVVLLAGALFAAIDGIRTARHA